MYFAFELYFLFILGVVRWDDDWRGRGGKTHAVRSVPFRQTGLASGLSQSLTLYGEWETERRTAGFGSE